MAVIIPPWLKDPDLAEDYTRGLQIGTQVAEAQARISAENTRTAMESQARQQTLQQEHLMQQARLATETAYKKTQLQLESDRLNQVAKVNAQKTQDAAMALADRQGLYADLQGGMDPVQAHLRHPRASSVANVETAQRMAMDLGDQRLALQKQKFEEQKRKDEEKQSGIVKIGTERTEEPILDEKGRATEGKKVTERDIYGKRSEPSTGQPGFPFKSSLAQDQEWAASHGMSNPVSNVYSSADDVKKAYQSKNLTKDEATKILKEQFNFE